ncbi:hypothetical protein ABE61_10345 [Lysinibacillus sphaericus]|nr:hypothetical protein [Lysinibacillus sphaericus]MBG9476587.1 hypothetical protein [Lysinibacillus sphaericus]
MIGAEAGRLLGDQRYRGTKAKSITSCDNAFVTNILPLPLRCTHAFAQKTSVGPRPCSKAKRLIGRPQESAQPERKSTHAMMISNIWEKSYKKSDDHF